MRNLLTVSTPSPINKLSVEASNSRADLLHCQFTVCCHRDDLLLGCDPLGALTLRKGDFSNDASITGFAVCRVDVAWIMLDAKLSERWRRFVGREGAERMPRRSGANLQ